MGNKKGLGAVFKKRFDDSAYIKNSAQIKQSNLRFFKLFDILMLVLLVVLYFSTYFSDYAAALMPIYLIFISISAAELLFTYLVLGKNEKLVMPACYFGILKAYVFCLFTSVIFNTDAPAVTYLVFLILIPMVFLLKPAALLSIQLAATVCFAVAVCMLKPPALVQEDVFNAVLFFAISLLMGYEINGLRISNLDMMSDAVQRGKELEENRNLLRIALSNSGMTVWEYDTVTKNITPTYDMGAHSPLSEYFINAPESAIAAGSVHPDSVETLRRVFADAVNGAEASSGDVRVLTKDRPDYWWIRVSISAVKDGGTLCLGTTTDITEQKNTELQYEKQMLALDGINEENLISKGRWNLTLNKQEFVYTSGANALPIVGIKTYEESSELLLKAVFPPEKQREMTAVLNRTHLIEEYRKGKDSYTLVYRRRVDNDIIWVSMQMHICPVPGKNELMCFASSTDITDSVLNKHILERLLTEEYDFFGTVAVKTGRSAVRGIKHGENPEKISSAPGDYTETTNEAIDRYVVPEEREMCRSALSLDAVTAGLENTEVYFVTFSTVAHDGTCHRKKMQYTYLDEMRDTILYNRADITDVYQSEQQQLQAVRDSLVQVEKANSAKSMFLSRMSHDMRTPMNGIMGMTRLTQDIPGMPREALENLNDIESSSKFLLSLINDTLDMSRIESSRIELHPEVVNSDAMVKTIINTVMPLALEKNIKLLCTTKNVNHGYIRVDKLRAQQVLLNVLSNAVKFTPNGGTVTIYFECLSTEGGMNYDKISVQDTGLGMSEEFLSHIYEPFSQENSNNTGLVGTGLGMSIVKSLVELMGGTIQIESVKNKGTCVTILISFERVENYNPQNEPAEKPLEGLAGKRVLLVEDHPLNATIAMRLLAKKGVAADLAENGRIAVDMFNKSKIGYYNAVLMDVRMPVMNGIDAAKTIRVLSRDDAETVPIIAMTANAYDTDVQATKAAGMNEHLSKPIEPQTLYETLAKYV